jgi:hypothetical protein
VLGLAADFLGAQPPDPVSIGGPHTAPAWMRQCVLRRWGNPRTHRERLLHHLRAWTEVWDCLQACWPDPITATTELRASFLHGPRWPIQIAFCATRTRDILRDLLSGTTTDSPQDRVIA